MPANPFENISQIGLDYVLPNPYQPREHEDPRHVAKVAESILSQGLLQPPVGRFVSLRKCELAFGHTRLAAYKLLTQLGLQGQSDGLDLTEFPAMARLLAQRISGEIEACNDWLYLPVNIRELSDEEMFKMGIGENLARKDLTPIEEARAMARYRDEFGKNSEQIGELFGLSGTAVRNKIRLLELPDGLKEAFAAGTLSEGAAREVLSLLALPQRMREDAEREWYEQHRPSKIIEDAKHGALAANLHERIEHILSSYSEGLSKAPWKRDEIITAIDSGLEQDMPVCAGCPQRMQRGNKFVCLDKNCYWQKQKAYEQRYLRRAAAVVGYAALEVDAGSHTTFYGSGGTQEKALQMARTAHCPNLRVEYGGYGGISRLEDEGFADAQLVCKKRNGFCVCQKAAEAGISLTKSAEEVFEEQNNPTELMDQADDDAPAEEITPQAAITMDELSEVVKEARRQKKVNMAACLELLDRAAWIISEAIYDAKPGAWNLILDHNTSGYRNKEMSEADVRFALGRLVAAGIHNPDVYNNPAPAQSLEKYNQALQKAGLSVINPPVAEDPGDGDD